MASKSKIQSDADCRRLAMNIAGLLPANRVMRDRVLDYLDKVRPFLNGDVETIQPMSNTDCERRQ